MKRSKCGRPPGWLSTEIPRCQINTTPPRIIIRSRLSFDLRRSARLHLFYFSYTKKRRTPRRGVNWRREGCIRAVSNPKKKSYQFPSNHPAKQATLVVEMPRACMGSLNFGCCRVIRW
ncbi:hypothetical protein CCUS01_02176 [Colletotrichum cuscutae]|uniref:Uncharacterized protein n=1 Tax=Colletotrichum cuscutae TaxID=1209917 RepID=A0AAI9XIG8_9PEZI|nr:hypothetical protein CCUS01_02176 [Colletotrichum cuscutae]